MGRQQGLVHLSGQFGDLRLSIAANGKPIAAFAPVRKGRVKRGRNYGLTRKNNAEFTGSAYCAQSLRRCMGERIRDFSDRDLSGRLLAMMHSVISLGQGRAGERSFDVLSHASMFQHIEANAGTPFGSRFQAPYSLTVNPARNAVTLDVAAFATDHFLYCPQGATHFRLLLVAGILSDFVYVGGRRPYAPVNALLNGQSVVASSLAIPAVNATTSVLQLVAALPGAPVMPSTAGLVVSVGIEFLRVINNYEEVMASGNGLKVVEVV